MRFANSPCYEEQQNLLAFQFEGNIYYKTYKDISPHTELLVWYGEQYGAELGILATNKQSPSNKLSDVNNIDPVCNFSEQNWLCSNCNCIYTSEVLYHRHMRLKHGKPLPVKVFMQIDEIKKNSHHDNTTDTVNILSLAQVQPMCKPCNSQTSKPTGQ